ncbi:MAG: S-layer homology domain-containing protein [Chloroflexota bacterium]|nr:S-layer homology domain-containing protein [Chloroflexota bacterium]
MRKSSTTQGRPRFLWAALAGTLFALAALAGGLAARPASSSYASTPSGGRLTDTQRSLAWQGAQYLAGTVVADRSLCSVPGRCDSYGLFVQLPAGYTLTQQISMTVLITWTNSMDDYDLYVLDPAGDVAASSASGAGTSEQAVVICPQTNVTYTVQVVPSTILSAPFSTYNGSAHLGVAPGNACDPNVPRPPGPPHDSGGITFNASTIVDLQRQVGEPDIAFAPNGDIYASGPWGTATQQSFAWKSVDNGDTYHTINRIRPDVGPGGGDTSTEVDDQNFLYFTDLEGLANISASRTTDGGNTFTRNSAASQFAGVDRQWMAIDNGATPLAADNTQFLTYRQAALGSYVASATDGQTFVPAQANPAASINDGAPCGDLRFDPVNRYLYLPCGKANKVEVSAGHVALSQRTGITFTTSLAGNALGSAASLFPVLAVDTTGNVYVTYVDSADHNVYLTYSMDHATTWSPPIRVNGNDANTALFPWIVAGTDGRVAIAYIATDTYGDPNNFPSWFNDKPAATAIKWNLYVNYLSGANTANPTNYQQKVTQHPMHYGQVCTSGTLCLATGGDRTMADFLTVQHDNRGAIRIIYTDTTNQYHGASVFEARQLTGPSLLGTTLGDPTPANPVTDPVGDAQYPHFGPTGPGPNYDALDIKGVGIISDSMNITVSMTISNLNASRVLPGASSVLWLTRWQEKSSGDFQEESYRIYYAGARSTAGGAPTFFYGTGTVATGTGVGCTDTTPQNCKLVQYPAQFPTTGVFDQTTGQILINVPRRGVGDPPNGAFLYSVTGYTLGTRDSSADFYDDVDVSKAFTTQLGGTPPAPCTLGFPDVPVGSPFYEFVRCLTCRGIVSGFSDGNFRPGAFVTRGQLTKIVSNSAAFSDSVSGQTYEDVPPGSTYYTYTERLTSRGYIGGYACGGPGEPCGSGNRPYFRTNNLASRGQISKIVSNAAGFSETYTSQSYEDVPPSSPFYVYIERLSSRGVIGGYACGGPGEPCGSGNRPYFRPGGNATRGQTAKISTNTFFPGCVTPSRPSK